jgi:hypothetical protein
MADPKKYQIAQHELDKAKKLYGLVHDQFEGFARPLNDWANQVAKLKA